MRNVPLVIVLVLGAAAVGECQEYRQEWAGQKVGTWVKCKATVSQGGATREVVITETVKTASADEVVMQVKSEDPAGKDLGPREQKHALKGFPGSSDNSGKRCGEEQIECDGRKIDCVIWEYKTADRVTKCWEPKDLKVPGRFLRMEQTTPTGGHELKSIIKAVKLSEKIAAAGQEFDCIVLELESTHPAFTVKGRMWFSDKLPGQKVKFDLTTTVKGKDMVMASTVCEFESK